MNTGVAQRHSEVEGLFGLLVEGELQTSQSESVHAHLRDCEGCQLAWTRYEDAVMQVRALKRYRAPRGMARRIRQAIRLRRGSALTGPLYAFRLPAEMILPLLMAAAAAAMLLALGG